MELVCNELSFFPLAGSSHEVEQRFRTILNTFNQAKEKYNFTHIRFPISYSDQPVTTTQNFIEWISSVANNTLKDLVLALFRPPYVDDLEEEEANNFFASEYKIASDNAPEGNSPIGMPIAFIKSIPTISFDSHNFWRSNKIEISKSNGNKTESATFIVYNICQQFDIHSKDLNEWAENSFPHFINSEELLIKYLGYQKFTSNFQGDFMQQFLEWKVTDMNAFKYILLLMKDVELHPFTGGRGRTENLKNRGKEASKRINITDRLSYSIENNIVTFIACKGHYEFHN
ncbi:MAG: type II toxin-antitoxin system YoeB family toxin [Parafilimonas sp.]